MAGKIIIPQKIVTFKESEEERWYQELNKENPFENDYSIISSKVPFYNRQKTIEKAIIRPERYFREYCVIKEYSDKFEKAYYTHSIQLFYAKKWRDQVPPRIPFQKELYEDFNNIKYFPPECLKEAQERKLKSDYLISKSINPKLPDVWLAKKYPNSIFIEVKRFGESFVEGQKEGLAIIKKYLGCDVRIARVGLENKFHSRHKFEDIDITELYNNI